MAVDEGMREVAPRIPSPLAGEGGARSAIAEWEGEGETRRLPTNAGLLVRAQWMRRNPTDAERRLWALLRARRLPTFKFRRQQIIFPYIVDFVSFERRLIIEADGSQHADCKSDLRRNAFLRREGFDLLRFWNSDILTNLDGVAETISSALSPSPSHGCAVGPSLSRQGRGAASGAYSHA